MMEIALGATYSSYEEFESAYYKFINKNNLDFKVHQSKSLKNSSLSYSAEVLELMKPLRYQHIVYTCSMRGYDKRPGFLQACGAVVDLRLDKHIKKLKVVKLCLEHDDSCCQVQYWKRRQNKSLNDEKLQSDVQIIDIRTDRTRKTPRRKTFGFNPKYTDDILHDNQKTLKRSSSFDNGRNQKFPKNESASNDSTNLEEYIIEEGDCNISDFSENDEFPSLVFRSSRQVQSDIISTHTRQNNDFIQHSSHQTDSPEITKVRGHTNNTIATSNGFHSQNSTPIVKSDVSDSADSLFFSSLCAEVQKLPYRAKSVLKLKLLQMVNETILEHEES
ncbi:uncharacterized protein LOC120346146 [Styela clava]